MIHAIRNIYHSEDLKGEIFLQPIKRYHHFFAKKIADNLSLERVAWLVANVITGIFAYPTFGVIAGVGIFVKWITALYIKRHNQNIIVVIEDMGERIKSCVKTGEKTSLQFCYVIKRHGWQMQLFQKFEITEQNIDEICPVIKQKIHSLTSQYKKVYMDSKGHIKPDRAKITIQLKVMERVNCLSQKPVFSY